MSYSRHGVAGAGTALIQGCTSGAREAGNVTITHRTRKSPKMFKRPLSIKQKYKGCKLADLDTGLKGTT
jgi:hypothetical protein